MNLNMDANDSDSPVKTFFEDDVPQHQFSLRSNLNLPGNLELDAWLRYVDDIKSYNIDSYFSLDLRLGWHLSDTLELSIVGQNLLDNHHSEYGESTLLNTEITEIERGVYSKLSWKF
jgi:iron complex outermembrane receptor protein